MKDLDAELIRLRQMRDEFTKEMAMIEAHRAKMEYVQLSAVALVVAIFASTFASFSRLFIKVSPPHFASQKTIAIASFSLVLAAVVIWFLAQAHKSVLGIKGYLKIEKTLLINEMPNIFQILSLLGFLNVFLKQSWVKIAVAILLTFLLLIYLTTKRREMISRSRTLEAQVTSSVTVPLSIALGCLVGSMVFGIASLVSAQI